MLNYDGMTFQSIYLAAYGKLHKDYSRHQNILMQPLTVLKIDLITNSAFKISTYILTYYKAVLKEHKLFYHAVTLNSLWQLNSIILFSFN